MEGLNLIVSGGGFCALYYKSTDQPEHMLRLRAKTNDYELLARAWMTANRKARELGWIVCQKKPGLARSEASRVSPQRGLVLIAAANENSGRSSPMACRY